MENASRALVMAGGILLGILILSLMVALFSTSSNFNKAYDEAKQSEAIQRFNTNFTKYLGKNLTIHQAVTISRFAEMNGVQVNQIYTVDPNIKDDVEAYTTTPASVKTYTLKITAYSDDGYVKEIQIN